MNTDIIDLASNSEPRELSDRHNPPPRSPCPPPTATSASQDMEDWPEDELKMAGQGSVNGSTTPHLSVIIPDDDTSAADSQSTPASPEDLPSPDMNELAVIGISGRRSDAQPSGAVRPSFRSLRRLFHLPDSENFPDSPSSGSATPENTSSQSQSDNTEITVPGSSPENPIDLSDSEDDQNDLSRCTSTTVVEDPRRRIAIPLATLAGEVDEAAYNGHTIRPSSTVKLANGLYLRVEQITLRQGEYYLWGRQLMGCHDSQWPPFVSKVKNELIWLPHMDHETQLESMEGNVPVSLMEVTGICRVVFTNKRRGRNQQDTSGSVLICRLKVTARKRPSISPHRRGGLSPGNPEFDNSVEYLTLEECDEGHGVESHVLRNLYRGCRTVPFGEGQGRNRYTGLPTVADEDEDGSRPVVDLTVEPTAYTFGDAYCGAGGTSCGAKQAGAEIKWACDMDPSAVQTYSLNFEGDIHWCAFNDLLTTPTEELRVDIAHCSPPCQTFSPAHTIDCPRDDRNSACIFSAWNLLEHALPRVLTMEETAGLAERHQFFLFRVIMDMLENGFSVRWAVIDVLHYGVPQTRKRLIVIAAGPGETLPPFPEITHDLPGSGCLPIVTIDDAIKDIPEGAPNHDVDALLARWGTCHNTPYDARQPAKTLTCSGGEGNYHPSGLRAFTCREVACLQTFPLDFQFSERGVRKQVGNAVPPALARALYRTIIASLRETDARELEQERQRQRERERERLGGNPTDTITFS